MFATWELSRTLGERPAKSAMALLTSGLHDDAKSMLRTEPQDICELEVLHDIQATRSGLYRRQALLGPAHPACKFGLVLA